MEWAVLLFVAVIISVHWWEYSNTVQEYTIAQPATTGRIDRSVVGEKTPVPFEIGPLPWRPEVVEKAGWSSAEEGPVGDEALAETMGLPTGLTEIEESRAWWWLPGLFDVRVGRLSAGALAPLTWVGAERRWIGCSHGGPLTLWLVHSRYRRYLPDENDVDPWNLTVADAPWIGRVQFIELVVRPGWCVGLPAHWGYAVSAGEGGSWWWIADQHSPLSWSLTHSGDVAQDIVSRVSSLLPVGEEEESESFITQNVEVRTLGEKE
jgi:hypothetical protein